MSLLRRVERGTPPNRPPSPPRQPASPIRELWHHAADGKLFTVTMTRDSRFIIAGSQAGEILFFDIAGRLLWRGKVPGAVRLLALAEDAECFLVGTIGGQSAYLWHYTGRLLHTFAVEGDTLGIDLTPDASLIVISTRHQRLYGFDRDGTARFDRIVNSVLLNLAVSADGERIFAGSDDQQIEAYDRTGSLRWVYPTGGRVWAGVRIAEQGRVLIAGSNDGYAYCLDFDGQERWKFDTGGAVDVLAVTPDGRLSAAGGLSNTAFVLDDNGNVLGEYPTGDHIYGLDISPDGRFLMVGSNDSNLYVVDCTATPRVWQHATGGRVYGAALAPNGQYFAAASADQNVYAFRNVQVDDDPDLLTRPDSKPLMRLVVRRVVDEYANAPHAGLVRWFSEFEKSLRSHQFDACRALLAAADEERGFELSDGEKPYIRSLEGVYWLMRGVAHHRHRQYDDARACYETSKAIQESLNNQDGTGQVVAALSMLPPPNADGEAPPDVALTDECRALLDEITDKPRVLGMSEQMLAQRLTTVPPAEQLQIVLLAQRSGYVTPLVKGLSADERVIRAAASAGLALLDPGPGYDVLVQMLESPLLFVKWQALRMLRDHAAQHPDEFRAAKTQVWPLVTAPDVAEAPDPLARREAVRLVMECGDETDTPWLIDRLRDLDPDVQIAAAEALGAVGDRRALPKLARVPNKVGFLGRELGTAAADARDAIEARHPTPTVEQVVLCDADPLQQASVQQSTLFLTGTGTLYAIVTVDHARPGAHVTVKWLDGDRVLKEEQITIPDQPDPRQVAEVQATEIVQEPSEADQAPPRRRSPFSRDDADEPTQFSPFRRRALFGQDEVNEDSPFGTARFVPGEGRLRPSERRPTDERPGIPSFLRDRPGFPRPSSADAPRPRPFGASDANPPRTRPTFGAAAPQRPARVTDPIENVVADELPPAGNGNEAPAAPVSTRPPLPGRFASGRPGAPRSGSSQAAELPPGLRRRDDSDDDDIPEFLRPRSFDRRGPERRPFDRFARSSGPDRAFPRRAARPGPSSTAQPLVFCLPCPPDGWKAAAYRIEVTLDEAAAPHQTPFQFIEAIKFTGLEPGVIAQNGERFNGTSTFLVSAPYVDGYVHLEQAPVNTRVTGRLYSVTTGTLVCETIAFTPKQGRQSVALSWENSAWQPGHYRLVAAVENGGELHADIELVTKIHADRIVLCHQVDRNNGPVGENWPFRPGDTCYCVVEFDAPPSGVEVIAAWYRQYEHAPISQSRPYITSAAPDQRSMFRLESHDGHVALTPGHYSIVVEGKNLVREERTFEVLPYSGAQIVQRAALGAYEKALPLIERYHLGRVILSLVMTALLVLALGLADVALDHVLSAHQRSGDAILRLAHAISHPGIGWGLGWLALGGVYAALRTRHLESLGKTGEERFYSAANLLLAFASSALVWYLASTIAFGAGHVWPGKWWGFFAKLIWLHPIVAWLAPIAGLGLVEWQRQADREKPFHLSALRAVLGAAGLMLIGWGGALVIGFPVGLLGRGLGLIVDAAGAGNHLGRAFLTVGAGVGFVLGPVAVLTYVLREDLIALGREWFQRKQRDSGPPPNLLAFLIGENVLPGKARDYLLAATVARRGLLIIGVAVPALIIGFGPVVVPVLGFFYDASGSAAFESVLTSSKWAVAAAITLLLVVPVLILSIQQRILSPLLSASDAAFTRGYSIAVAVSIGIVPLVILLTGRAFMARAPNIEVGLFWANHAAALVLLIALGAWLVILHMKLPDSLRAWAEFDFSADQWTVVGIALLAGLLLPGWMWALLLVVVMLNASSALLWQRVR